MYRLAANWNVKMTAATASDAIATPAANSLSLGRCAQASGDASARSTNGMLGKMP